MKPRSDITSSRSCSCTSCFYKSESEHPSVRRFVAHGSRIDKLFIGKYLPLREEKLLNRLIKTRAEYDDIRTSLLSDHNDSDVANLKPTSHMPMRTRNENRDMREYDCNERSSALLELVSLIDRGAALPHRLSECCSCCVCGGSTIDRRNQRVHIHKHGVLSSLSSMTSGIRSRDQRRASRHAYRAKNIQSDPCTCTSKNCGDEECDMKLLMRNRTKPVFEQYEGTTLEEKSDRLQKVKGHKNKPAGMGESLKRFMKSKETILMDTKSKVSDQVRRRTKRYLNSEIRYSLRHQKEKEEEEVKEAIEELKRESLAKLKEEKRRIKEEKMRRNTDVGKGPYEGETQYTMEKKAKDKGETRHQGEKVPKVTAIQTEKDNVDAKTGATKQKPKELNASNIKSQPNESDKGPTTQQSSSVLMIESVNTMTPQPKQVTKKDKFVVNHPKEPAKKNFGSGGYALKRCFCTLKLKPKIHKNRGKGNGRSIQTVTSKTQTSATSECACRPMPCGPDCMKEDCNPIECPCSPNDCLKKIKRRGVNYTTTPSNTRKLKQSTKSTSKIMSNDKPSLLPYECEPGVCVPNECDPIECDKLIKKRGSYAINTELKRHSHSVSSIEKRLSESSQTSSQTSEKAMKTNVERAKEKHVQKKDIPVPIHADCACPPPAIVTDSKVGEQKLTAERPSQISTHTKSGYSFTKHKLKRCFCTLKLSKRGKIQTSTHSKGTLTSSMSVLDKKQRPALRDSSTMMKERRDRYKLQKYECEPGICVPDECDPYQCLELIKKRYTTQSSPASRPFKRKTKSTYSIARKRLAKSRTIQSVSSLQEKKITRGQTASAPNQIVSSPEPITISPKKFESNPSPGNRQVFRISSSFSFDIGFYKENGDATQVSRPQPVTMKVGKSNKRLQRRTKSHHRSTSMQTYTQNEGVTTSSATKRCFCTLKLQKRAKNPVATSAATETVMTKDMYPKVDIMVTRSTKMKRKDIHKLEPCECECKDFGSSTDNKLYKKSTASLTSSLKFQSKNVLVRSNSGRIRKKRKRSKYTTSSSFSKAPISPNISSSRQAIRIGSNISFSVEFYKNRSCDMADELITIGSTKKVGKEDRGHGAYKTRVNDSQSQSVVKKANKGSWIQPFMKRCFCTLKLQKNNTRNPAVPPKTLNPVVMTAQIYNDHLQKSDKNELKYISMKRSFSSRKNVFYRSSMFASSIDTISDIWFNSKKSIVSSDMAYEIEKTLRHERISIQRTNSTAQSPFVRKSVCAMNVHGIQRRTHKLEPYECEPGVCIPGECDPYQCQKLIMKRLTKRSSTMTGNDSRTQSTLSGRAQTRESEQQYGKNRKKKATAKRTPQAINYKLPPAKSRKQAVKIGSAFSFDVEFFKNRTSASPDKVYHSPASIDHVKKRKGQSVGSSPHGRKYHDKGLRGAQVSYDNRPSQSGFMTQDRGSSAVPRHNRCFCTLQLKKRGKMQVQVGHEARPTRVPYIDAAQNTKKYNISRLDPNECEPGVCVPGICDPYECLERIKRRRHDSKNFGTGMTSQSESCTSMKCETMKCPLGKCVQTGEKHTRPRAEKYERAEKYKPAKIKTTNPSVVREKSPSSARQAVKLGSTFSFNVEFYKDKTAQPSGGYVKPTPLPKNKPKKRKKYNQGTKQTTSSITRAIQDSPGLRHQDSQAFGPDTRSTGTKTGRFLKRCFCTLKLLSNKHPEKPPKIYTDASNQTLAYKEKPYKIPKLEPYECEPGVCVPGECDPYVCAERIKQRNRAAKMSGTDFEDTRSTSTIFRTSQPTRSTGAYARERERKVRQPKAPKEPKETKAVMKYKEPKSAVFSSDPPCDRSAVKIGSTFSFDVEFYKIKYPAIQRAAREVKERRMRASSTSSQSQRKLKNRGVNKHGRSHNRKSQGASRRGDRGTGTLKRCFCTLALQADNKDMTTQGTDTPYYKTYPKVDDKNTLTKKLLPYECEPGVCIPGECDPYECLKRIQRRREFGTSTKRRGTTSTSSLMEQPRKGKDRNIQSRREKTGKTRTVKQPIHISKQPRQHKQAVKIGSAFSFNVEFSKSRSGTQEHVREREPKTVRMREPKMAKYRTSSTNDQPEKRMSTMGTSHESYLRDTDSQVARNMRSSLTETRPFLKRCFCTLQFKNSDKNQRQAPYQPTAGNELECDEVCCPTNNNPYQSGRRNPVNVYTATINTQCKELDNYIYLNSKTRVPVKKKRSSYRKNHRHIAQVQPKCDIDVEFWKHRAKDNCFYTHSPHVYQAFNCNARGPFNARAVQSRITTERPIERPNVERKRGRCSPRLQKDKGLNERLKDLHLQSKIDYILANVGPFTARAKSKIGIMLAHVGPLAARAKSKLGPLTARAKSEMGRLLAGWNVGPVVRKCSPRLQNDGRLNGRLNGRINGRLNERLKESKIRKLDPFECEPNVCLPGQCDPYECLERIRRRNKRDAGVDGINRSLKSKSSITGHKRRCKHCYVNKFNNQQVFSKQTFPRKSEVRNNFRRHKGRICNTLDRRTSNTLDRRISNTLDRRISNTFDTQDRHSSRVGSSFSCNIEFYKDCSPPSYENDRRQSVYDNRQTFNGYTQRKRICSRKNIVTNTSTTSRRITANVGNVRDKCLQTKCAQRDMSLGIKPLLQRCFCTLKLQKHNKINIQDEEMKPIMEDKNVAANFKHRVLGMLLDPNECEPGVCIPGQCDPYECLERIKKRNLVNRGTGPRHCNKVQHRQTSPVFGSGLRSKKIQYEGIPTRDSAIVETPRMPFMQPDYWNGVRFGSNIKCSIEFYKDIGPGNREKIPATTKMGGDSNIYRPTYAQGHNQTYKTMSKCNKAVCPKRMDGTMQTRNNTEDKSSIMGNALKRCFCTAKLQNRGRKTTNDFIVGRMDKLITNSPFQPKNFQIYRMQKNKCPNDPACNDMETLFPYAPKKFNKIKSKSSLSRKGILKNGKCKCCKNVCNEICTERSPSVNKLTAKENKITIEDPNPVKSFFCRLVNGKCKTDFKSPQVQDLSQNDPKKKPLPLCKDCMKSKNKNKSPADAELQESSKTDPKEKPLPLCKHCLETSNNKKSKNKKKTKVKKQELSQKDTKETPLCKDCLYSSNIKKSSNKKKIPCCTDENKDQKDIPKDIPCKNCEKYKTCKCAYCKCLFCKYNVKRRAKNVKCRSCKKHLNTRDYDLICAHCGMDISNEENVIEPTAKPSNNETCKCEYCKCLFCKSNPKRRAEDVVCRNCKKRLKKKDYGAICAHCGMDISNEEKSIEPAAKPSKKSIKQLSKIVKLSNFGSKSPAQIKTDIGKKEIKQGNGDIKSPSNNKIVAAKKVIKQGEGDGKSPKNNKIDTSKKDNKQSVSKKGIKLGKGNAKSISKKNVEETVNQPNKKCADSCAGIDKIKQKQEPEADTCSDSCKGKKGDKKKKKGKENKESKGKQPGNVVAPETPASHTLTSPASAPKVAAPKVSAPPAPTCADTCLKPHIGFKLSITGGNELPILSRKPPCVCGSNVCATRSLKERFSRIKKESMLPKECLCGSSVCREEYKKIKELKEQELKKKENEEKEAEAKKEEEAKLDEQIKKEEQKKKQASAKSDAKKEAAQKKKETKQKIKERLAKQKKDQIELRKKEVKAKKKKAKMQKKKESEDNKKKLLAKKLKKKKELDAIKAVKLKAKRKREHAEMLRRRKIYKKEDKLRRQKRAAADARMLKRVKKTKEYGDCALLTESIVDIGKLGCVTLGDILRSAFRTVTDPKNTYYGVKTMYQDPMIAVKSAKDAVVYSGLGSTFKRVGLRISMMERFKRLIEKIESNHITHTIFHMFDKRPPKFRPRRRVRVKEPMDFDCSPYMASLRRRPWVEIWYSCPWFYPHCLSLLNVWKQCTDVLLFLLAVVVWSPCLFVWEALRALMCCTMCTQ